MNAEDRAPVARAPWPTPVPGPWSRCKVDTDAWDLTFEGVAHLEIRSCPPADPTGQSLPVAQLLDALIAVWNQMSTGHVPDRNQRCVLRGWTSEAEYDAARRVVTSLADDHPTPLLARQRLHELADSEDVRGRILTRAELDEWQSAALELLAALAAQHAATEPDDLVKESAA